MTEKDLVQLWMGVYIAAIASGSSSDMAEAKALIALTTARKKFSP